MNKQKRIPSTYTKRVVFGGGGNLLVYQLGIMKFIIQHFGKEKFISQCTFEGVSAGASTAGYSLAACYDCHDFDYWFENGASGGAKNAANKSFGMLWTTSDAVQKCAKFYAKEVINWHRKIHNQKQKGDQMYLDLPEWIANDQFIFWVTAISGNDIGSNKAYSGKTSIDGLSLRLSQLAMATSWIPFVLNKWFYCFVGKTKCIDGCNAMFIGDRSIFRAKNRNNEDCKVLYINCDFYTKRKHDFEKLDNGNIVHYLDIWKWGKIDPSHVILWGDMDHTKNLYRAGYNAAKQNVNQLDKILNEFFT